MTVSVMWPHMIWSETKLATMPEVEPRWSSPKMQPKQMYHRQQHIHLLRESFKYNNGKIGRLVIYFFFIFHIGSYKFYFFKIGPTHYVPFSY